MLNLIGSSKLFVDGIQPWTWRSAMNSAYETSRGDHHSKRVEDIIGDN